jgi:hypothetical protein
LLLWLCLAGGAWGADAAGGALSGHVRTAEGSPVAGAAVSLNGPSRFATQTDPGGGFTFAAVPAGVYALQVTKAGFGPLLRSDVVVTAGERTALDVSLTPASFSSLQTIGRVATSGAGTLAIDTTPAAIDVIAHQAFLDQGSLQVTKLLEETPGVTLISNASGGGSNRASLGAPVYPQLRGSLYYETESLIDGHPVSVAALGTYNPLLTLPALLQNIEIAKGPGSMPAEINYAVGGTVNYRTLEPTRDRRLTLDLGADRWGGSSTSLRATGSTANNRLAYAFAYATLGTPGPLQNYGVAGSQLFLGLGNPPWSINGQAVPGIPVFVTPGNLPQYQGPPGSQHFSEPLYTCCTPVSTDYNVRGQLAKLRYNFSDDTALTVSYLGGQSGQSYQGTVLNSEGPVVNFSTFAPLAGYTGSVAPGTSIPFDLQANTPYYEYLQQNLFQAELRTALRGTTLLARAYSGFNSTLAEDWTPGQNVTLTENTWGGMNLCPAGDTAKGNGCLTPGGAADAPVATFFNGQPVAFTVTKPATYSLFLDHVRGLSIEGDRPMGEAVVSLAYDQSNHDSYEFALSPSSGTNNVVLPQGSAEAFRTILARVQAPLGARVSMTFATYVMWYAAHYTGDGGVTWTDVVHNDVAPRLAFTYRPNADTSWRFAIGSSIAPPYISLLSSPGTTPVHNPSGAAQGYFVNANNGQIAPEKGFGFNLGFDRRMLPTVRFSTDFYFTHLRDMFLTETRQLGTYTPTTGTSAGIPGPLYVTQTANLGNARYEGVEFRVEQLVPQGVGFKVEGSLQRAFTYGLTPAFYSTTAGPNTTNLGVLPEINFQASGNGFNAASPGRIPYSQGYAELNYRTRRGFLALAGYTYFGPNNSFNLPAFGVLSASVRFPVGRNGWLQLSGDNLTNVNSQPWGALAGGVPVPLVNGKLGVVAGSNYGPPALQLMLHQAL